MPRLFTDVLADYRNGILVETLSEELAEVVTAVVESGQSGELTLKLKIEPYKGDVSEFKVTASRSVKLPRKPLREATFFPSADGALVRQDPRQRELFGGENVVDVRARAAGDPS